MVVLHRIRQVLNRIQTLLAASSLLLLLLSSLAQILARNLFDAGFAGADSLARYLVLYVTFAGAALAVDQHRHIRIDAANLLLSDRVQAMLYRPLQVLAMLVCLAFTHAAVRFWRDEWAFAQAQEQWQVLVGLVIPAGFALLSLHFLLAALCGPGRDPCPRC